MKNVKLVPYKKGSKSAKDLAGALGVLSLKLEGSRWNPRRKSVVINWGGSSHHPAFDNKNVIVLNDPEAVAVAVNKLSSFETFQLEGIKCPQFTTDKENAVSWTQQGATVVCRKVLQGHSGEGIVIASCPEEVVDAPLYTSYIPKVLEYRIHVMDNKAFFCQRKARVLEVPDEEVNWKVRNLKGGFIYANQDVVPPEHVIRLAIDAVDALGLHFGAVDVILNKRGAFVLEVNTACGLAGTTLEKYVTSFRELIEDSLV